MNSIFANRHARNLAHPESRYQSLMTTSRGADDGSANLCTIPR